MDDEKNKSLSEFSEKERKQAFDRFNIIKPFVDENVLLTYISKETGHSYRTLCRWIHQYRQMGLVGLIYKERNDSGEHRSVRKELQMFIEGLALKRPKMSVALIYRKAIDIGGSKHNPSKFLIFA